MRPKAAAKPPKDAELRSELGPTYAVWRQLVAALSERFPPIKEHWRDSKIAFGRICLLERKDRTLVYLLPRDGSFELAVVLGERAYGLAIASDLPSSVKALFSQARPYAEGRGIRWPITSLDQVPVACRIVEIKIAPK